MYAQQEACRRTERGLIIVNAGAVGGAHLFQHRAGLLHDFRDAETAAYLYKFPARDNDFRILGKRVQREESGGCAVIHDDDAMPFGLKTFAAAYVQDTQY